MALFIFPLVLAACAPTGESTSGNDPTVISRAEIQGAEDSSNAYTLVQQFHPEWLKKRGQSSIRQPGDIVVYVDNSRRGGPDALRRINVIDVELIEFLRPDKATMRYGSGHDHGAILVHLKEGP